MVDSSKKKKTGKKTSKITIKDVEQTNTWIEELKNK